ncbi:MAG: bifunctional mannitol-1-phosphate dehydrogenase/phosphatase [Candidatus Bathyarchaeia archaeon]
MTPVIAKVTRGCQGMLFQNKTLEGAIFDMDGTMFDTERLRLRMLKQASKEIVGEEISDQLLYDSFGVSAVTAEKFAKARYGENYPYKEIRARSNHLEVDHVRQHGVPVKEGLYNLLERLKKNGVLIALATSSKREIAEEYLLSAKVLRFFDIIVCGEEVEKGKPDPEIFLKAARELNCEPSNCFIFEDSQNGILAASASGGTPIYIKDIKEPDPEVKALAFRSYDKMTDLLDDFIRQMPKMDMPSLNEHFPQSVGYMVAGIHGFGAMGGGYLAQIFSHWDGYTRPRKIVGVTSNDTMRQLINALGRYQIKYERLAHFQTIQNVTLIDQQDEAQIVDMYKQCQIVGLAIPERAVRSQAKIIAKGLLDRYDSGGESLTILIIMNKIHAARFVRNHVLHALKDLTCKEKAEKIVNSTYFSETVVNRIVSRLNDEVVLSRLQVKLGGLHNSIQNYSGQIEKIFEFYKGYVQDNRLQTSPFKNDSASVSQTINVTNNLLLITQFAEELSQLNITLFSSEPDMPLYASKGSPLLERLRQVVTVEDIRPMQEIKNKLSNGPHAIIAWYSALLGYRTIGQGMGDPKVSKLAESIIINEIKPALLIENPGCKQYIKSITMNFFKRCRASFQDECLRVGRDPLRKLQFGERIMGTIHLAQKHGLATSGLEFGAACAIMYSLRSVNGDDMEAQIVKQLYEARNSVGDVLTYKGECSKSKFTGLDPVRDAGLIERISVNFENLKKELELLGEKKQ